MHFATAPFPQKSKPPRSRAISHMRQSSVGSAGSRAVSAKANLKDRTPARTLVEPRGCSVPQVPAFPSDQSRMRHAPARIAERPFRNSHKCEHESFLLIRDFGGSFALFSQD